MMYNIKKLKQGKYSLINPEKYKGDVNNIVYRSGLEFKYFRYCDLNYNILKWSSEEVVVEYFSQIDNKKHRYFLDLWIKTKNKEYLIEIKPEAFTKQPKQPKHITLAYQERVKTWIVNNNKWKRADEYAKANGMEFRILTEKDI